MSSSEDSLQKITQHIELRRKASGTSATKGSHRIDLEHVENLRFRGIAKEGGNFSVEIDEPADGGGRGLGPRPSSYFLIGVGSCLLMQWAKIALAENMNIDGLRAIIRGHTISGIDGRFSDFVFDISVDGNESEENIKHLATESERFCFIGNTLKRAVPCTTNVKLNGKEILRMESRPG